MCWANHVDTTSDTTVCASQRHPMRHALSFLISRTLEGAVALAFIAIQNQNIRTKDDGAYIHCVDAHGNFFRKVVELAMSISIYSCYTSHAAVYMP